MIKKVLNTIKIKLNSFNNYYIFNRCGIPVTKNENISKSLLRKYLPKNPVIIDCGAHDGSDSIQLHKMLKAELHSFEPVLKIFNRLKYRSSSYPNIHCYNIALGNLTGTQLLNISEGESDASSSFLEPMEHLVDHPETIFNERVEVKVMTLDDWGSEYGVTKVDLLWLDMQGFELEMLKASKIIFPSVKVIHTEVSTKKTYKNVPLYEEYRDFLLDNNFIVVKEAIPPGWDFGNVLFIRK